MTQMVLVARSFQVWFDNCRPQFLMKTEGSAMIPKKHIIASLNDAFEAGRAAGRIDARSEAVAVSTN